MYSNNDQMSSGAYVLMELKKIIIKRTNYVKLKVFLVEINNDDDKRWK